MFRGSRAPLSLVVSVCLSLAASCAGVKQGPGGTGGDGGGGSGNGPTDGPPAPVDGVVINTAKCGNGALDPGEQCDDSNRTGGDGCTPLCQLEDGWGCPTAGQPCSRTAACGNGMLEGTETCDDHNMKDRRRLLVDLRRSKRATCAGCRAGPASRSAETAWSRRTSSATTATPWTTTVVPRSASSSLARAARRPLAACRASAPTPPAATA